MLSRPGREPAMSSLLSPVVHDSLGLLCEVDDRLIAAVENSELHFPLLFLKLGARTSV